MRRIRHTLSPILLALLVGLAAPASAQIQFRQDSAQSREARAGDTDRLLRAARRLMSNGDYLPASEILESVYATEPGNEVTYNLLKTCYLVLKFFHKQETLAQRFSERFPENTSYRLDLAQALAYQSRREEALAQFHNILGSSTQPDVYRAVFEHMLAAHLEEEALAVMTR